MKAVTFQGTKNMQVKNVKDPEIQKKEDINDSYIRPLE